MENCVTWKSIEIQMLQFSSLYGDSKENSILFQYIMHSHKQASNENFILSDYDEKRKEFYCDL
jgi:hypothetical protein